MVKMYTTHCPKCKVLEMKLKQKNIVYEECDNVDQMLAEGLHQAPALVVDGQVFDFHQSIDWINSQK